MKILLVLVSLIAFQKAFAEGGNCSAQIDCGATVAACGSEALKTDSEEAGWTESTATCGAISSRIKYCEKSTQTDHTTETKRVFICCSGGSSFSFYDDQWRDYYLKNYCR